MRAFGGAFALLLSCLLLVGPAAVAAEYEADGPVEILSMDNFDVVVLESSDYWLVEFYGEQRASQAAS